MLNTKDMQVGSGKARPLVGPGNNVVRINSITLDQTLPIAGIILLLGLVLIAVSTECKDSESSDGKGKSFVPNYS